jgi:hypothetical protein
VPPLAAVHLSPAPLSPSPPRSSPDSFNTTRISPATYRESQNTPAGAEDGADEDVNLSGGGFDRQENAAILDALQPDFPEAEGIHDPAFMARIEEQMGEEVQEQLMLEEVLDVILDGESTGRAETYNIDRCRERVAEIEAYRARLEKACMKKGCELSTTDKRVSRARLDR